jgi:hypothetical protein
MCAAEMKMPGMASELIMDLRGTLEWLKAEGDLIETDVEVDPDLEIASIQRPSTAVARSCSTTSKASRTIVW